MLPASIGRRARASDPSAALFYNDYLADGITAKSDTPLLRDASYHPKPPFFGVRDALLGH